MNGQVRLDGLKTLGRGTVLMRNIKVVLSVTHTRFYVPDATLRFLSFGLFVCVLRLGYSLSSGTQNHNSDLATKRKKTESVTPLMGRNTKSRSEKTKKKFHLNPCFVSVRKTVVYGTRTRTVLFNPAGCVPEKRFYTA